MEDPGAKEQAIEAEVERIKQDPAALVEALWRWHDADSHHEDALGAALRELCNTGFTEPIGMAVDQSVWFYARYIVEHPPYAGALYGDLEDR